MLKKQTDKFLSDNSFLLRRSLVSIILVAKCYMGIGNGGNSAVADGCTVGVSDQVGNGIFIPVKGFLEKGKPCFLVERIYELLSNITILEFCTSSEEGKKP